MAIIYKNYQDRIQLVNSNLVGKKERKDCEGTAQVATCWHPAAKNDWGIVDRIRGCLGRYLTVYSSSGYAYHGLTAEILINYSGYISSNARGASLNTGAHDTDIGRLRRQLTNIVLDYEIDPTEYPRPPVLSLNGAGSHPLPRQNMYIFALPEKWNAWQNKAPSAEGWLGYDTYPAGIVGSFTDERVRVSNNFESFMNYTINGFDPDGNSGEYFGLMKEVFAGWAGYVQDHTSIFYGPPRSKETREKSGLLFDPSPTYNFYVQTRVSYEGVVENSQVKEWHLPNAYYLQHELKNTSSTLLAPYHLDAITLGQNIDYFEVTTATTVTEANTRSYYNMYTDGLQNLVVQPIYAGIFQTANSALELKNKNFAVLHSDLDALAKGAIHLSTIPFYNTIAIGAYQDQITGYESGRSILNALWNDKDTRDMVDLLQLTAIRKLTTDSQSVATGSFTITEKRPEASPRVHGDGTHYPSYTTDLDARQKVLFDLKGIMYDLRSYGGQPAVALANLINNPAELSGMPFKLIRNYDRENLNVDPQSASRAMARMFDPPPVSGSADPASVEAVTRPIEEIYNNTHCHTETLLYVIHKRKVWPHTSTPGPIVQTFYISPRLHSSLPAYFYDSQVKYNQGYRYEVSKVVLVFGNYYTYAMNQFNWITLGYPQYSPYFSTSRMRTKAAINVLNYADVKAILVPHVLGGLDAAPIIDKPPREPEISFYAYKGINDKLLILLNATTGRTVQSPVQILEGDKQYFEEEYFSQSGVDLTFDEIKTQDKKIIFKSDDPVDRYQLFKLRRAPISYEDFSDSILPEIDPDFGVGGTLVDTIQPNMKYYYCARSIDVHENVSNPTHIFEIEIVDNNGQIFLKQKVFNFEKAEENFIKSGRRFIYIEPALQQTVLDLAGYGSTLGTPSLTVAPPTALLGATELADRVWGKGFKIRLTSKQTGRKLDLNINFTNTGKVKPSE